MIQQTFESLEIGDKESLIRTVSERARILEVENTPTRRLAQPEDVADAMFFLASRNSGQINGQTLYISGGALM